MLIESIDHLDYKIKKQIILKLKSFLKLSKVVTKNLPALTSDIHNTTMQKSAQKQQNNFILASDLNNAHAVLNREINSNIFSGKTAIHILSQCQCFVFTNLACDNDGSSQSSNISRILSTIICLRYVSNFSFIQSTSV